MGWFSDDSQQRSHHEQWNSSDPKKHEASFAHELIAGAASYEAAKAYEEHEKREGKCPAPTQHHTPPILPNSYIPSDRTLNKPNLITGFTIGKPESHEKAKEIMAGFAGAFVDREVETRGLDFIDKEKAKREARKHIDGVPPRDAGW
ncbi:CipC1 protein [Penicillium malachiteum]|uniref:CipC1 protein n=1 Tax=Penicillium malachiteum TaxID=1324776 RepID=A0AAD6HHV9_9EURO|nr:CipC1 protein [Penicillium malachiteum]